MTTSQLPKPLGVPYREALATAGRVAAGALRQLERHLPEAIGGPLGRASRRLASSLASDSAVERESRARTDHMRRVCSHVTRFIAPSAYMRDRFAAFGIPHERITVSGYGFDHRPFAGLTRTTAPQLRLGFLGSLMVSKAPHILLEAFARLPRGSTTVTLFGAPVDYHGDATYRRVLVPLLARSGVRLAGPVPHEAVAATLANVDVLVVPSIWAENSPLVIHEAFLAGVPVVASRVPEATSCAATTGGSRRCGTPRRTTPQASGSSRLPPRATRRRRSARCFRSRRRAPTGWGRR